MKTFGTKESNRSQRDYDDETIGVGLPLEPQEEGRDSGVGVGEWEAGDLDSLQIYLRQAVNERLRALGVEPERAGDACAEPAAGIPGSEQAQPGRRILDADRRRLVLRHLDLVVTIARHYQHPNLTVGDLIQEGNLGLMLAARDFDPEGGTPFGVSASFHIRHAICRALSTKARTIRIPVRQVALRRRAAIVADEVEQRCRNESTCDNRPRRHRIEDDAREIGVEPDQLRANLRLVPEVVSLDAPVGRGAATREETLADTRRQDPCETAAEVEARRHLEDAISHLPPRLRRIMRMRYGFDGGAEAGFAEIGRKVHLTPQRVHQLHRQAVERLRRDPHFLRAPAH